jgi:mxaC protein
MPPEAAAGIDFAQPWALLLLPAALLPWLRQRRAALEFSTFHLLPADPWGDRLQRAARVLASLALGAIVVGLAGPGRSGGRVMHVGHGAEIQILFDRSSSMDQIITPPGVLAAGSLSAGDSKNSVARGLLARFVARRADDRFALMTFSTRPMRVAPFSDRNDAVLAGLAAAGIGRGLPETDLGSALLAAIGEFEDRAYSGSRVVLIVSDGGAHLDETTQRRIRAGLQRNRIGVDFIYLRSSATSPDLRADHAEDADPATEEVALHRYFQSLATPYHLYQADDPGALAAAMADIDRQQNLPLTVYERVPREDWSRRVHAAAAAVCALLLGTSLLRLTRWTT